MARSTNTHCCVSTNKHPVLAALCSPFRPAKQISTHLSRIVNPQNKAAICGEFEEGFNYGNGLALGKQLPSQPEAVPEVGAVAGLVQLWGVVEGDLQGARCAAKQEEEVWRRAHICIQANGWPSQ